MFNYLMYAGGMVMNIKTKQKELQSKEEVKYKDAFLDSKLLFRKLQQLDWDFADIKTSYFTHDFHPYPAKFIPQLPSLLIGQLSQEGEVILDPFGGSGTTALEAIRLGRTAISLDANPISKVIGKAKTTALSDEELYSLKNLNTAIQFNIKQIDQKNLHSHTLLEYYKHYVPNIPNIQKWFSSIVIGELALLRHLIEILLGENAKNLALTAFMKVVMRVSNQESETRYVSKAKKIKPGCTLKRYYTSLKNILDKILKFNYLLEGSKAEFRYANAMDWGSWLIEPSSVELIVTSPPYPNAYDYHLYHRFRIFWLGSNPQDLRNIEIGSHLRYQSEKIGFESYVSEMGIVLKNMYQALMPGRYAALVVGNGIYKKKEYKTGKMLLEVGEKLGFEPIGILKRNIPSYRRSIPITASRLQNEDIVLLRKPEKVEKR